MDQDLWTAVDEYIGERLLESDPALDAALAACEREGLPPIGVTPNQGKLLQLLVRIHGARKVLELGTLGGYSTIWLARGLPAGGRVVTLEVSAKYAEVARANIDRAGVGEAVEIVVGPALEALPELHAKGEGPFDLIFIDADKQNYPGYFEWSLKLSKPGTVIVGDNVVRAGAILGSDQRDSPGGKQRRPLDGEQDDSPAGKRHGSLDDSIAEGVRGFYEMLAAEPRVEATAIQTVGAKGHDGFALALVTGD